MLDRLKQYIEYKGLTVASVERSLGMSNGALAKPIKNHTAIGSNKLQSILAFCGDLSLPWLFFGRGSMIIGEETAHPTNEEIISLQAENTLLRSQLSEANKTIQNQAKELGRCEAHEETVEDLRIALAEARREIETLKAAKNATTPHLAPTPAPAVP